MTRISMLLFIEILIWKHPEVRSCFFVSKESPESFTWESQCMLYAAYKWRASWSFSPRFTGLFLDFEWHIILRRKCLTQPYGDDHLLHTIRNIFCTKLFYSPARPSLHASSLFRCNILVCSGDVVNYLPFWSEGLKFRGLFSNGLSDCARGNWDFSSLFYQHCFPHFIANPCLCKSAFESSSRSAQPFENQI